MKVAPQNVWFVNDARSATPWRSVSDGTRIRAMILGGRLLAINPAWTRRDRALLALAWLLAALDAIAFGRADPRGPAGALAYVVLGVWSGLARVPPAPPSIANSPYRIPTLPAQRPGPALAMRILLWPYVGLHLLVLALMALLCVVFWGGLQRGQGIVD